MRGDDILTFVLVEVMKQHPSYTEVQARALLPQLHQMFGGSRYYIPKEPPALKEEAREAVRRDMASDMPPGEVQSRHGVSRSAYYRLVKQRNGG